ncbi:MAG TPA: hypothetical protein VHO84_01545, partial [Syntrophorhabdaceae bacterium]|nr:hypothetical protein [Syntrophorhabdaceae bacterium]
LVCSLILFSTEKWTGIPSLVTALGAFAVLMGCGIIRVEDVSRGINWDIVNFIAIAMSLTSAFSLTGISAWAGSFVQDYMLDLAARPLNFLLVTTVALFAIRFVDVPWGYTTIALFSSLLLPLFNVRCLHPVLVSVALIAAGNSFFLSYQQPFVIIGDSLMGSGGWTERHVIIGGCLYAASVLIGISLSFFYWRAAGLLP